MKRMSASLFRANCIEVRDEVKSTRQSVIITNNGEPIAKLVPVNSKSNEIFGFFSGKGRVIGDVVSPALSSKEWSNLNGFGSPLGVIRFNLPISDALPVLT